MYANLCTCYCLTIYKLMCKVLINLLFQFVAENLCASTLDNNACLKQLIYIN